MLSAYSLLQVGCRSSGQTCLCMIVVTDDNLFVDTLQFLSGPLLGRWSDAYGRTLFLR
jgi:hypothetical protein